MTSDREEKQKMLKISFDFISLAGIYSSLEREKRANA